MVPFFKDQALQKRFERDGFVVLPFLNDDQVKELHQKHLNFFPDGTEGFYASSFIKEHENRKSVSESICNVFQEKVDTVFQDYKKLGGQFLIKNTGEPGKMPFHQDWTVVDEKNYCSVTIWVPLQDINEENGAIRVLRGSHTFSETLRSPTLPDMYAKVHPVIDQYAETLNLKAGEAFIFNHAVLHGSHLNRKDIPRLAAAYGLIPQEANLCFYYSEDKAGDRVEKFDMPDTFFIDYFNDGNKPEIGSSVGNVDPGLNPVTEDELLNKLFARKEKNITMRPIFKDTKLQESYDKDGFVKMPLLDADEVKKLLEYYHATKKEIPSGYGFHISLDDNTTEEVKGIFDTLFSIIMPKLEPHLDKCKAFTASYVIKEPGLENIVPPHQDWTFVEEEDYCSATVWVPLMDVTTENGALGVIRGSHRFFNHPRSSPSPQSKSPLADHIFTIFPYIEMMEMKAGEAFIFNNKTIHASPPNTTDSPRIAAGIGITQEEAQLIHCYHVPGSNPEKVEVYEVEKRFFTEYNNKRLSDLFDGGKKPEGLKCARTMQRNVPNLSVEDMKSLILSVEGNRENTVLVSRLKELYKNQLGGQEKPETEQQQTVGETTTEKRSFFQTYTPSNIIAEIRWRLSGKKEN